MNKNPTKCTKGAPHDGLLPVSISLYFYLKVALLYRYCFQPKAAGEFPLELQILKISTKGFKSGDLLDQATDPPLQSNIP